MEKPDAYSVSIELPNLVEFDTWEVMKVDLDYQIDEKETGAKRVDVLIGMDILSQGDFAVTHFEGKTCFSFRMPSIRRIDYNKPG